MFRSCLIACQEVFVTDLYLGTKQTKKRKNRPALAYNISVEQLGVLPARELWGG